MPKYKIYYGLGGSFGGAKYQETEEFENKDEAIEYAYSGATEKYQSYEGLYGLRTYADVEKDILEQYPDATEDDIDEAYNEEMERWITYKVEAVGE